MDRWIYNSREETRGDKIIKLLIMHSEDIEPLPEKPKRIWWHVVEYLTDMPAEMFKGAPAKVFGFATEDSVIVDAPDWKWKGKTLKWLRNNYFQKPKRAIVCQVPQTT